jgi:rhodanese-related sulfurtransferase
MYPGNNPFEDVPQVDPQEARDLLASGEVDILDVREKIEWDDGHIDGAKWLALSELPRRWREIDPARRVICVCHVGERSLYAASMLRQAGIDASNMEGGMMYWQYRNLPITPPNSGAEQ